MRKTLVPVVVALCCLAEGRALAQEESLDPDEEDPRPRHTITTNPLTLLTGTFGAEFESATRPNASWFLGPSFAFTSTSKNGTSNSLFGFGATAGARVFSGKQAPNGFWAGPQLSIFWISDDSASAVAFDLAALAGYTWIFDGGFALSLGGGVQYIDMKIEANTGGETRTMGVEGVFPALRLALGFAY